MPVSGTCLPLERVFSDHAGFGGIPVTCGSIGRPVGNNAPGFGSAAQRGTGISADMLR